MTTPEQPAWERWCAARERALAAPESWLGLAGLYWLEEGTNLAGADLQAAVILPHGPAPLGEIRWRGEVLEWLPAHGEAQALLSDHEGSPTIIVSGVWT